ncbi:MAG TPA: lasso peptide biosynthesis B2 protein [Candidatus Binatia bacterium]|nr:lasso peptide biosynthesis B2 protein [Candidatus Binatia bacterium]
MRVSYHKFRRLSRLEKRLLLQALFLLPLVALTTKLFGFKSTQCGLATLAPSGNGRNHNLAIKQLHAFITAKMVRAATRHGAYRANCLHQSLVLWWLLRRQGIESDLRIGVHKTGGSLAAHAWVERLGHVLNGSDDVHKCFAAFGRSIVPGELK